MTSLSPCGPVGIEILRGKLMVPPYNRGHNLNDGKIEVRVLRGIGKLGTLWVPSMSALPNLNLLRDQRCCNKKDAGPKDFLHSTSSFQACTMGKSSSWLTGSQD